MLCPNCGETIEYVSLDNQNVLHCRNCGSSFFEENGINRITEESAQKLFDDKKTDEISGHEKKCPKDQTPLVLVQDDDAVPSDVALLKCRKCKGIFTYPEDLLLFKKAQNAKVEYFKAWHMPLPSVKTVLVFTFLAVVSFSLFTSLSSIRQKSINQSQAQDLVKGFAVSKSGHFLFVSFKTAVPVTSRIVFADKTTRSKITKTVSEKAATLHYLSTGDVNLNDEIYYSLTLTDARGNVVTLPEKKLEVK